MPPFRLNEHYTSVQGEGPRVGVLTQFVRFSGCNMRCPGWPCDTQHAIQPALYRNDPKLMTEELLDKVMAEGVLSGATNICLTGGEPFLQDETMLLHLARELLNAGYTLDIFTNGSFPFPLWIKTSHVVVNLDWKLPGSGEAETNVDTRRENAVTMLRGKDAIKFVCTDASDLLYAKGVYEDLTKSQCDAQFFVGRAWDKFAYDDIIDFVKRHQLPWRLNVQTHKYIWPDKERGI